MLKIENLSMELGGFSLKSINLQIDPGEYFVLAGPSGSGKSLLLETIAGIFLPSGDSKIILDRKDITHTKIQQREIGLVFQDNTLFTHLSVKQNIEYALKLKYSRNGVGERLHEISREFGVAHLLHRNVRTLSGGEAQRVLLARAFAANPKIMLLDEPLSAVDADQRDQLKGLLRKINRNGLTIIHVTHDFEEAFSLASSIGIMHNGMMVEKGKPAQIIEKPRNKFAARFYGYKNFYDGFLESPDNIRINKTLLKVSENAGLSGKVSVLIDASKIEVFDAEFENPYDHNFLEGFVTDHYNSMHGLEMNIKSDFDIHFSASKRLEQKQNFRINQKVLLHIPANAIKLIGL